MSRKLGRVSKRVCTRCQQPRLASSFTSVSPYCPDCKRELTIERDRERKYGLSPMEYNAILREQSGICAVCGSNNGDRDLYVDHNHATGRVRGLLCTNCNSALGQAFDNPGILRRLADYLERNGNSGPVPDMPEKSQKIVSIPDPG